MLFLIIFGLYLAYVGLSGRQVPTDQKHLKRTLSEDLERAKKEIKSYSQNK